MVRVVPTSRPLVALVLGTENAICLSNARKVPGNGDTGQMMNCLKESHIIFKVSHKSFLFFTLHMYMLLQFRKSDFPPVTELIFYTYKT